MTYVPADPLLDLGAARDQAAGHRRAPARNPSGAEAVFLEAGRTALWGALRSVGLGRGDRLVAPAYICDSILPAATALGIQLAYVRTNRDLRPDLEGLERELASGARAVLAVHYFGFPAADLARTAELCERYGAAIIEDRAHCLFGADDRQLSGDGTAEHVYPDKNGNTEIYSPWKSLSLPDGGILVQPRGTKPATDLARLPRPAAHVTARRLAYRMVSLLETRLGRSPRLYLLRSSGLRRGLQDRTAQSTLVARRASRLSEAILQGVDVSDVGQKRRANYARIDDLFGRLSWAQPLFEQLPEGIYPLGYPVLVEDRERARARFLAAGVNVRAYWERLPAGVSRQSFADAHYLADRILVLPVHQSLTPQQMSYLQHVLEKIDLG